MLAVIRKINLALWRVVQIPGKANLIHFFYNFHAKNLVKSSGASQAKQEVAFAFFDVLDSVEEA